MRQRPVPAIINRTGRQAAARERRVDDGTGQVTLVRIAGRYRAGPAHRLDDAARPGPSQFQFWLIALAIGIAAGFAALLFRKGITLLQGLAYGTPDPGRIHSIAEALPWYWLLAVPAAGGLLVGLILHRFTDDARARSVAEVIEGAALEEGRVEQRAGLASALASMITLGTGGSSGREGPVVHLAGVVSSWVSERMDADAITGRDLLGCAVAAAVSASFNAPIAGALFALEVVLRHFAVHAFAPIVIASVAGTVINRLEFGDITEFTLPLASALEFYVELPAFLVLGLLCGVVATVLMHAIFFAEDWASHVQLRARLPRWLRPAVAGILVGCARHLVSAHHRRGVRDDLGGPDRAAAAARGRDLRCSQGRGGGDHHRRPDGRRRLLALADGRGPHGLAFGLIATALFPEASGSPTLYALAGMGGVAAAVLGAPHLDHSDRVRTDG